ncbi:type II toxin-antitoxin system Phd/YefM family antitoxin [Actinotignum urinale]|uniref:type II toxin-antitoxin system Phd/YefM family antitoxin n=1 Tax=Actinotignum urinale TaxID=190146 RepID=UPI0003B362AF|nr:type II toxin-antitoxin system prevent-host-death family antitoxin [Actinotignum urinale]MDY5129547.1 type II toxin-antitoxin system prevent-host-death family antitoxin [Actinotignum urinale]MDY5160864.1 type II toxin-antitoxin system prevent-host-death family antitoxin [Actinotignum urinale]
MNTISVAQMRQNPTRALNEVQAGETYIVTRHQVPIAQLIPINEDKNVAGLSIIPARHPGKYRLSQDPTLPRVGREKVEKLLQEMAED